LNYLNLCEKAILSAERAGAEEAEALIIGGQEIGVNIERAEIKACSDVADIGMAIRAIIDGKMGFAYTNMLKKKQVEKTAIQAVKASNASVKDKNWKHLPERERYPDVQNIYDARMLKITSDDAVVLCRGMMAAAVEVDKKVLPAFGGTEISIQDIACVNSHGIAVEEKGTALVCYLQTMARSETQVSPSCFEFKASRMYEPDPEWIGREAARLAVESLNVGKAETGKFPVLLDQIALQSILTFTFIEAIKGDMVYRGRSAFGNKIGQKVAEENITIYDDGTLVGGLYSGKTDLEGVPKQKTSIIENGTLHGFLYDNYWARLERKKSTGNAQRGGGGLRLPLYGTIPTINPTNIRLQPGKASDDELVSEVRNGYYVRSVQGAHQSNPETGEFSVALAPAWRIENGEITQAVKGVMIAGNAYEMLSKISLVGRETRQVGTFIAPKVIVSKLNVISK